MVWFLIIGFVVIFGALGWLAWANRKEELKAEVEITPGSSIKNVGTAPLTVNVVKESHPIPINAPPVKHLHSWVPVTDMLGEIKSYACAGCSATKLVA